MVFSINTPVVRKIRAPPPEIKVSDINREQTRMILQMNMIDRIAGATNCASCKGSK